MVRREGSEVGVQGGEGEQRTERPSMAMWVLRRFTYCKVVKAASRGVLAFFALT